MLVQAGELSSARARNEVALAVRERLAASNPGSAAAQRDLCESSLRAREVSTARARYEAALAVSERLC